LAKKNEKRFHATLVVPEGDSTSADTITRKDILKAEEKEAKN
jgi:hypothetical protein